MWVTATSRTAVLTRYAQAAVAVTGIEDPDPEVGAARLLAWLASTTKRWLLVLDDLADPTELQGLWPPAAVSGRTVVTTRRRDAAVLAGRAVIDVGIFTENEAASYLRVKLGDRPGRLFGAADLAAALGHLPLALAQAAAYIVDNDLTCAGYRRRLVGRRLHMLHPATLPDDQRTPVTDTWQLSIDVVNTATGGTAGIVLELAGLLDPNGIPRALFTTTAVIGYCHRRIGRPVDSDDVHDALRALHRLSLITDSGPDLSADPEPGPGTGTAAAGGTGAGVVRIHALLQRVAREHTPTQDQHDLAVTAADAIAEIWPDHEPDAGAGQSLRANTAILHQNTGAHLWTINNDAHRILFQAGKSLGCTGLVAAARDYFQDLHTTATEHLGPDHPDTLDTRHNLAEWRAEAGDRTGAVAALGVLLADYLRVLGPDHPNTLTTRTSLASWRGQAGDVTGAAAEFGVLLADYLRVLGPDHPGTLYARYELAHWRGEAADPAGAVAAFEELLRDELRVLGPDHPYTLTARHNLARRRGQAGDPAAAAAALEVVLTDRVRVLGPDHPDTLATRHTLAHWREQASHLDPSSAESAE